MLTSHALLPAFVQSLLQRALFKAFADGDLILVDTTHKVSSTHYKLATIMAVSSPATGQVGVPVAFAVISSEDERMLEVRMLSWRRLHVIFAWSFHSAASVRCQPFQVVFRALRHYVPDVVPQVLITDMALAEWNAARTVYPELEHRCVPRYTRLKSRNR